MAKRSTMQNFARWHIWLGWAVAVPMLLWLASGLLMAARPIEVVRGEELRRPAGPLDTTGLIAPRIAGGVTRLALVEQGGRPVWVVTDTFKAQGRYDARTGVPLPPVSEPEARGLARSAYAGKADITAIRRFAADRSPGDLRRPRPSWQAEFADGNRIYLDADTGEVLALRTGWWRIYDFAWGLHIMDLQTREDTSNPWLWTFGGGALISGLFGTVLLFRRRKAAPRR